MTTETLTSITEPGVYDLPDADYFADPVAAGSLSNSGAKDILDCPAVYRWKRDNPQPPRDEFDLGHAVHAEVLGVGAEVAVIDGPWTTKAAKAAVEEARADGKTPLKPAAWQQVQDMAAAVRRHELAAALLQRDRGRAEQAVVWRDEQHRIWRRAKIDWLPEPADGRMLLVDLKTAETTNPQRFGQMAANYLYPMQAYTYSQGVQAVGLATEVAFLTVAVSKQPPYVVIVGQYDDQAMRYGERQNDKACRIYARCQATGIWSGYADDQPVTLKLPAYLTRDNDEDEDAA